MPALLLTPKSRLIAPVRVWRRGPEDFLLLTEPELGEAVRATLAPLAVRGEVRDRARGAHVGRRLRRGRGAARRDSGGTVEVLDADASRPADGELERARIEAGVPAWGKELDDSILPAEAGLDETHVSFTKGCYPGQEPVARLRHRGKVNRRLRVLEVEPRQRPVTTRSRTTSKAVGRVTSASGSRHGCRARLRPRRRFPTARTLDGRSAQPRRPLH